EGGAFCSLQAALSQFFCLAQLESLDAVSGWNGHCGHGKHVIGLALLTRSFVKLDRVSEGLACPADQFVLLCSIVLYFRLHAPQEVEQIECLCGPRGDDDGLLSTVSSIRYQFCYRGGVLGLYLLSASRRA